MLTSKIDVELKPKNPFSIMLLEVIRTCSLKPLGRQKPTTKLSKGLPEIESQTSIIDKSLISKKEELN
jgi:hypothetical protein